MTHTSSFLQLTECPRDALQGLDYQVPTDIKIEYIRRLLMVGFPILDFGSFVSPKAIPQMADTAQVLEAVAKEKGKTQLLAIVANLRGAHQAASAGGVDILGFPLSVSEEFQQRNTGKSITEALTELDEIAKVATAGGCTLTVYLSMAFGNPYGEIISPTILRAHTQRLLDMGVQRIALSDTVGKGNETEIAQTYADMAGQFPDVDWVCHLHARPGRAKELVGAAHAAGCRSFDVALGGYGGCPLSGDALTGNLDTQELLAYAAEVGLETGINRKALAFAQAFAPQVFTA